ncbi:MAG: hypothetical protein JXC33_02375 [Deltaproteobacteria bacterium]|nr:hypothetical protein [Deltaproteobacteria bacterium]
MHFNIKRYGHGLSTRRNWLLLILLPPLLYLLFGAMHYDRFSVNQSISISKDTPFAHAATGAGITKVENIISNPDIFFLNNYAVRQLYTTLYAGTAVYRADRQFRTLLDTVRSTMTLTAPTGNLVKINYSGPDERMGRILVGYFSQRLMSKSREGIARSRVKLQANEMPAMTGAMNVEKYRAFWRADRTVPFVLTAFFSVLAILVLIGVLEWSDPSFKSERQVAQYVDLPIIGSLPNLNRIYAVLEKTEDLKI